MLKHAPRAQNVRRILNEVYRKIAADPATKGRAERDALTRASRARGVRHRLNGRSDTPPLTSTRREGQNKTLPNTPPVRGVSDIGLTGGSDTPPLTPHPKGRAERGASKHASRARGVRRRLNERV
jgi:hypothetical protein